jgi:hypothetical protein
MQRRMVGGWTNKRDRKGVQEKGGKVMNVLSCVWYVSIDRVLIGNWIY